MCIRDSPLSVHSQLVNQFMVGVKWNWYKTDLPRHHYTERSTSLQTFYIHICVDVAVCMFVWGAVQVHVCVSVGTNIVSADQRAVFIEKVFYESVYLILFTFRQAKFLLPIEVYLPTILLTLFSNHNIKSQ